PSSAYPGALQVKVDDTWIGRVLADGTVAGPMRERRDIVATLAAIAAKPAEAAAAYGALKGCCAFCNQSLEAERSTDVGYGPRSARTAGPPHRRPPPPTPPTPGPVEPAALPSAPLEPVAPVPAVLLAGRPTVRTRTIEFEE